MKLINLESLPFRCPILRLILAVTFSSVVFSCSSEGLSGNNQGVVSVSGYDKPVYLILSQEYNVDPEIGRWLRTKNFRVALSLAINRETINQIVYQGLGTPGNWLTRPDSKYHPGHEWALLDAVQDVERAKNLLDQIGLVDLDGDGIRDRSDGNGSLVLRWSVGRGYGVTSLRADVVGRSYNAIADLIKTQWRQIGIESVWYEGNDSLREMKEGKEYLAFHSAPYEIEPWEVSWWRIVPMSASTLIAPEIGRYHETHGSEGMAPTGPDPAYFPLAPEGTYPADSTGLLKKLLELWGEGLKYSAGTPERVEISKNLFKIVSEEKYTFGLVWIGK